MLNYISGRYAEILPAHHHLLWLMRWVHRLDVDKRNQTVHLQGTPTRRIDTDIELMLTLARQQITSLTK